MPIVSKPLKNPNFCFICESSNDVDYWDSLRFFAPPMPLPSEGRKYVCRDCIEQAAKEFEFLTPEKAKLLQDRNNLLESMNKDFIEQDSLAKAVQDASLRLQEQRRDNPMPDVEDTTKKKSWRKK